MAPPIPGLRTPVQIRRRTPGDVLAGVGAIVLLVALTVGVPIALITVVGLPLPHTVPKLSALTSQLDITAILRILSVIVWLAWIQLVWCVLVEIKAAASAKQGHAAASPKVPLAGATQSLAHRLVTAALLLFTAAAALTPAVISHGPPRPAHSVSAQVTPAQLTPAQVTPAIGVTPAGLTAAQAPHSHHHAPNSDKMYTVNPPVGRFHESLWEIAHNHLGDGRRYREIFELNSGRVQPDGSKLTIASLIRPGWQLLMPKDAHGPGIEAVTPKLAGELGLAGHPSQRGVGTEDPELPVGQAPSGSVRDHGIWASPATPAQEAPGWPYELSAASLLAAGVLAALGRKRREQLWRRAFGRRIAGPDPDAALAEKALRLGADDPAVRMLDTGLRYLSRQLGAAGRTPPTVFAAHLGQENLDLWVAPPDPNPPRPWQAADGGQVWRLPFAAMAGLDAPDTGGTPGEPATMAPYPGLVSLGTNDSGRVLVDLEVAHGLIAVRGPRPVVQAALSALAVELVTNRWSDHMRVTLIGFGDGLAEISPERVEVARTLDEILPDLEKRAAEVRGAMASAGIDSVLTGRSLGPFPATDAAIWAPNYLIMGVPPTQAQAERLLALARSRYRMGFGYVIAGDIRGATWTWDLSGEGRLRADALGFDLEAQLLPPEQYAAVVKLFRGAAAGADVPLGALSQAGAAPAAHLAADAVLPVEIGLLGHLEVQAPGPLEPDRLALATELVVYLAAHPDGVHTNVLTGAVWPRGVSNEVRDAALSRVHAWLGTDEQGQPNLVTDESGRLRLGPGARVDWQVFRALFARASQAAAASEEAAEAGYLERALTLVRGQFLDGRDPARYAWLATDEIEYEVTAAVADAAHRLSALRLAAGDPDGAMEAARAGLRLAFNDEILWR
ncbi:MAG TPA: bacterial transcriptional activator domain-containing protein, partial [Streptosporangiaceae bacterium]|nr:bacterial transcriptional activator domain-containing protein [Streptosporangiaceae bacterium]